MSANFLVQNTQNTNQENFNMNNENNLNCQDKHLNTKDGINHLLDYNCQTSHENLELFEQVKKVVEYNTNYINKLQSDVVENSSQPKNLHRNLSVVSGMTQISNFSNDNIKLLNEFKNNIDDKLSNLKKKLDNNIFSKKLLMNYSKFQNIKKQNFLTILYFLDPLDLYAYFNTNKFIRFRIIEIIVEYCKNIVFNYEKLYLRFLKLDKKFILFQKYKKNKKFGLKINFVIKSQIISNKFKDKTVAFGYKSKYMCDKESFSNVYKFDVRSPGPLSFWIMREYTNVNKIYLSKFIF